MRRPRVGFHALLFLKRAEAFEQGSCYRDFMRRIVNPAFAALVAGGGTFGLLRWLRIKRQSAALATQPVDRVEQADEQSFPASDPPPWTLGEER